MESVFHSLLVTYIIVFSYPFIFLLIILLSALLTQLLVDTSFDVLNSLETCFNVARGASGGITSFHTTVWLAYN